MFWNILSAVVGLIARSNSATDARQFQESQELERDLKEQEIKDENRSKYIHDREAKAIKAIAHQSLTYARQHEDRIRTSAGQTAATDYDAREGSGNTEESS